MEKVCHCTMRATLKIWKIYNTVSISNLESHSSTAHPSLTIWRILWSSPKQLILVKGRLGWNTFYRDNSNIKCKVFTILLFCVFVKSCHELDVHERNNATSEIIIPNCALEKEVLCSCMIYFLESNAREIAYFSLSHCPYFVLTWYQNFDSIPISIRWSIS